MAEQQAPREQFQEAVMGFRKAAYEFGMANLMEDHATMLVWQRRLFELYDSRASGVALGAPCHTCGEAEPFTGTCGTSLADTKALCNRAAGVVLGEAMDERSLFERIHLGGVKKLARRNEHGEYVVPSINDAWAGWQSARAAGVPGTYTKQEADRG